ncbi:DNA polymerase-1 [Metamycoplasma subdolum]|uniref:5'-3' exonuclease n=1 Tax=Metamycoplasma subdolum TaxID=92407 RepID=A0A3M0A368_9BACT|nr:5'-3' exonuclease H3TH domain-containing protein [Metamycoplasma subdolum]RMA79087.1 DNA polymerase-1 [Metamycoplasma subdolum]WPB50610.1 5'-3' exonuclease H3TH domain-containing protein [Metamycoplasma subdolum]
MKKDFDFLIVDGTYLTYRSYYAMLYSKAKLTNSKGEPTAAVAGFLNTLISLQTRFNFKYIVFAFDAHAKTFRHEIFTDYKANRKKAPEEFYFQLTLIQKILESLNFKVIIENGFEADDVIAKIVKEYADNEKLIFSADQDLNQLINNKTSILKKVKQEYVVINNDNFREFYDFNPNQVIDFKAIVGDPSDNFKGVEGIGPKTCAKMLEEFGNVENIYENLDKFSEKISQKLLEFKEIVFKNKYLATLRDAFTLPQIPLEELDFQNFKITEKANEFLEDYELKNVKNKLIKLILN